MKALLFVLVAAVSLTASAKSKYITVEVCGYNEAGDMNQCKLVTYKDRGATTQTPECVVTHGEATEFVPCDQVAESKGHVPAILAKINKWFTDRGFVAPKDGDIYGGGAN